MQTELILLGFWYNAFHGRIGEALAVRRIAVPGESNVFHETGRLAGRHVNTNEIREKECIEERIESFRLSRSSRLSLCLLRGMETVHMNRRLGVRSIGLLVFPAIHQCRVIR